LAPYRRGDRPETVIPNPVPSSPSAESSGSRRPGRIAFIGRIDGRKGADLAILAAGSLMGRGADVTLSLAGANGHLRWEDDRLSFHEFLNVAVPSRLHSRFDYRGVLSPREVSALRAEAAVVVVPSRYENFPYSVIEAMAEACPVVASASYGSAEVIEDGRTGRLFPPGDADALADTIADVLSDPGRAGRMGFAARSYVAEVLNPERLAAETVSFYRSVLQGRSGR
jgi:glycosyltransferase involved in cell wall biosynthesis